MTVDHWLSAIEITDDFGLSKDTNSTWLSAKAMPGHRICRLWKFQRDENDGWVTAGVTYIPDTLA